MKKIGRRLAKTRKVPVLKRWVAITAFAFATPALAESSAFDVGGSVSIPMGNLYTTLSKAPEIHGDFLLDPWSNSGTLLRFSGSYAWYSVKNAATTSFNTDIFGLFAGFEWSAPARSSFSPQMGLQIGGVYDFLSFPNASGTTQNASIDFAARMLPGMAYWISERVGAVFEFPVTAVFVHGTVFFWDSSLSLRFRL